MSFTRALNGPAELNAALVRVGKFFYKASVAFGPLAVLVILTAATLYLRRRSLRTFLSSLPEPRIAVLCLGYLLGNLLLFFMYPIEVYYLLPATFFFLLLAGSTFFQDSQRLALLLLLSILSFDFVWPVFVRPNVPGRSTGAYLSFGLEPGFVVRDTQVKAKVKHCRDGDCLGDARFR